MRPSASKALRTPSTQRTQSLIGIPFEPRHSRVYRKINLTIGFYHEKVPNVNSLEDAERTKNVKSSFIIRFEMKYSFVRGELGVIIESFVTRRSEEVEVRNSIVRKLRILTALSMPIVRRILAFSKVSM